MEKILESKLNMYNAVGELIDDNPTIISTVPAFKDSADALRNVATNIRANNVILETSITGYAANKNAIKESMINMTFVVSSALFAFAKKTGNLELKAKVDFSLTDLKRKKDSDVRDTCKMIAELAQDNLASLADYAITAAKLTTLNGLIDSYLQVIPAPRNQKAHKKGIREKNAELFKEADNILKEEMDKTVFMFKPTYNDFVNEYFITREIIDAPTTKTAFTAKVTSPENVPLLKASIDIVELGQKQETGEDGICEFKPVKFGTYTIKVEAPGFIPKTFNEVKFKLGENTHLDIELEPA